MSKVIAFPAQKSPRPHLVESLDNVAAVFKAENKEFDNILQRDIRTKLQEITVFAMDLFGPEWTLQELDSITEQVRQTMTQRVCGVGHHDGGPEVGADGGAAPTDKDEWR